MTVYPLAGVVRDYAWGSRTALARMQGRAVPSGGPEAELWLGAHPADPSTVTCPDGVVTLSHLIEDNPKAHLGAEVAQEFGPRLPYLMKLLAADTPLSLQAHPDAEYARRAFAAQEADPALPRNYTDAHHKPEMLVALSDFEALCGFRDPAAAAEDLAAIDAPTLEPVVAALRRGPSGLAEAVRTLLAWPADERVALVDAAAASSPLAASLAAHYPGDPGVLVALLLNHVRLEPGQAIWMPPGNLHAYLEGFGVEIMAASDNVLRGGLTGKRVDVEELLRVLRFEVLADPLVPAVTVAPGVTSWPVGVRDFALYRIELEIGRPPVRLSVGGPRIVVATAGDVLVAEDHGAPVEIIAGSAAYVSADAGSVSLTGVGTAFVAAVPDA